MAARVPGAVQCCCRHAASLASKPRSRQAARCFSTSSTRQKNGPVPYLDTSESAPPELTNLLETIRNNVFMPAHLRRQHQNLIYRKRNHSILISDPVAVTIGDEDHTLRPLDRTKDMPDSWKSLLKAMDLMGTSAEDWHSVFPNLLEGFRIAGRRWRTWQWELLLRRAGQSGNVGAVVEAARRAERTGLSLTDVRLVREVFWGCRAYAAGAGMDGSPAWEEAQTARALRYAEQIAGLMDLESHCGDERFSALRMDPRTQPDCLGVLLELAAVRAQEHLDNQDEGGKVQAYATRLVKNLEKSLGEGMDANEEKDMTEGRVASAADYELLRWVPVMNGLGVARNVLGDDMPQAQFVEEKLETLKAKTQSLGEQITGAGPKAHIERRRGLKWLEEIQES